MGMMCRDGDPTERADRMQRGRARACLVVAAIIAALTVASVGPARPDFLRGMALGVTAAATLYLPPLYRWARPSSPVARLFDDESTREHRRVAATAGLVAAVAAALALAIATETGLAVSAPDTARLIAAAGMVVALVRFATLERRAQRG